MFKTIISILLLVFIANAESNEFKVVNPDTSEVSKDLANVMKTFFDLVEKEKKSQEASINAVKIKENKESEIKKKIDKLIEHDKLEASTMDSKFTEGQKKPIPLGYSESGNTKYAYIDFRGNIYKLTNGQTVLGFKLTNISQKTVSFISPAGSNIDLAYVIPVPKSSSK